METVVLIKLLLWSLGTLGLIRLFVFAFIGDGRRPPAIADAFRVLHRYAKRDFRLAVHKSQS